jgi:hypothetical protein
MAPASASKARSGVNDFSLFGTRETVTFEEQADERILAVNAIWKPQLSRSLDQCLAANPEGKFMENAAVFGGRLHLSP